MLRKFIYLIPISIFLTSCNNNNNVNYSLKNVDTNDLYYKDAKVWEKWLNLSDIEKGTKDFELRLWYNPELLTSKRLLLIRNSSTSWQAIAYWFNIRSAKLDSFKTLIPKSGWENFQGRLTELRVQQLPGDSTVPAALRFDDGNTFIAEVTNKNLYRFSTFSNPKEVMSKNEAARRWVAVIDFLNQEFDFPY
jgi:hypothetical protein